MAKHRLDKQAPRSLPLRVGAKVRLLKSVSIHAAKSEWEVTDLSTEGVVVARAIGRQTTYSFKPVVFELHLGPSKKMSSCQIPLQLNYSNTFASTVGLTLAGSVFLDFSGSMFSVPGMTYTVLARFPTLDNVKIEGLKPDHFVVNPDSLEFWNSLEPIESSKYTQED